MRDAIYGGNVDYEIDYGVSNGTTGYARLGYDVNNNNVNNVNNPNTGPVMNGTGGADGSGTGTVKEPVSPPLPEVSVNNLGEIRDKLLSLAGKYVHNVCTY